jgi:hypothetical protein
MGTAFSAGLNGDGFFYMGWMGTVFSAGLDGFFGWIE